MGKKKKVPPSSKAPSSLLCAESIVSDKADGAACGIGYRVLHDILVGLDMERVSSGTVHMAGGPVVAEDSNIGGGTAYADTGSGQDK